MISRRGSPWLLACCALLMAAPLAAATLLRQAVLVAPGEDGARLELDLPASAARPKVFTLSKPHRLVIDLPRTSLAKGARLPAPAGPVRTVRDGVQPGGTLRLVLELKQGMSFKSRTEGNRFIVELGRAPAAAAMASTATPAPAPAAAAAPAVATPVRAEHAPRDAGRDVVVAIDAGHGGDDPGAIGKGGTREKDVVLKIAQELAKRVNAQPGMRAYLTRNDDRRIPLPERTRLARVAGADIFISVHADSVPRSEVTGSSVYVLSEKGASSEAARWLADQENAVDRGRGEREDPLASVLVDLSQTASIGLSADAAQHVLAQLDRVGTVRKTRVQSAAFVVLKSRDIPALLVETAFISNPGEEKKLRTPAHQQAVADAIFKGVLEYFRQSPPDGTYFAREREERRLVASSP
ncbi:MAG TPA: N-acetylmuramoyl-L-alanine amidase [Steroidobacteraceae bacterium]|nr:N-acetylmuramoyl-L-alanine amidase [Steroidobacteraceae bacterium]